MIPLFRPSCTDLEIDAVTEVLRSGWWATGPKTEEFEERFAEFTGTRYAVAVSSCTAALELVLDAYGIRDAEVIVPALTFVSTGLSPLRLGNRVVFADVDPVTLCLDWDDARRKVTRRTRAIIPVWYAGTVTETRSWSGVRVIEDCAHAAGNEGAGAQGDAACWSFQAVKNIATGDGGMITTNDADLAHDLRALRWCGIDRSTWERENIPAGYGWDYDIPRPGQKAQMTDIAAALGIAQLTRLPEMNKSREQIAERYLTLLGGLSWLRLPEWQDQTSWHLFTVRVPAADRDRLIRYMLSKGVSAGVHYKPLNRYPMFGEYQPLPVTDVVWKELVTFPLFPDMTAEETSRVADVVRGFNAISGLR